MTVFSIQIGEKTVYGAGFVALLGLPIRSNVITTGDVAFSVNTVNSVRQGIYMGQVGRDDDNDDDDGDDDDDDNDKVVNADNDNDDKMMPMESQASCNQEEWRRHEIIRAQNSYKVILHYIILHYIILYYTALHYIIQH